MRNTEEVHKIQWHPGFYGGIELTLIRYKDKLTFEQEHQLSKEPLRMDLLIIKKDPLTVIEDDIGRIFRGYNIVEYKSPEDSLSVDDLYKTIGYAFLYKGLGVRVDEIPANELTVSVFRDRYPREMLRALKRQGVTITEEAPGVYYLSGITTIPTQLIVTSRLSVDHPELRILSDHVKKEDIKRFASYTRDLADPGDRNNVEAVLHVSVTANQALYDDIWKEDGDMSDVYKEWCMNVCKKDIEQAELRGETTGALETLYSLVHDGLLSLANGAARANMTEDAFTENMNKMYTA